MADTDFEKKEEQLLRQALAHAYNIYSVGPQYRKEVPADELRDHLHSVIGAYEKQKGKTPIYIIVCGCRDFNSRDTAFSAMNRAFRDLPVVIVEGEARGADQLAKMWAKTYNRPYIPYPADWNDGENPNAGRDRNSRMLLNARGCLAFWDDKSPGTFDMIRKAKRNRLKVWICNTTTGEMKREA